MRDWRLLALAACVASWPTLAEDFTYKERLERQLIEQVPKLLESFDAATGHFGDGIWVVNDQHAMYPLAAVYALERADNAHYKSAELLDVIMRAGDALIADADADGKWEFRKKDGSTWGRIHMPWTYSRWVRAFAIIKDDMPADRRERWTQALLLGYGKIAESALGHVHNIPSHHAMGLYIGGKALDRPEWCEQAAAFLRRVAAEQREGGYWSEGSGPVVAYNFVYVDAIGTYYALSRDAEVLPALERAAAFHFRFTYPNGHRVETIDERNPYEPGVNVGNVGFTFTPVGRAYLGRQWALRGAEALDADLIASLLLYGVEGPAALEAESTGRFVLTEDGAPRAATLRQGPWFLCLSAYCSPVQDNRWLQDRQNLLSVYHDRVGLIVGGGNTKLQPAWSTFTVGDTSLLRHEPGDTSPDFMPKGELYHIPGSAALVLEPALGLDLKYGTEECRVRVAILDERRLGIQLDATVDSGLPVAAHLTLLPHIGESLRTDGGQEVVVNEAPFDFAAAELAGGIIYAECHFELPASASVHWPAKRHNPYAKDGAAPLDGHRIEIRIPFDEKHLTEAVIITVQKSE